MINYKDIKIGDKQINTVYLGDKLIFQKYDISTLNVLEYAVEMGYQKSSKIYIDAMDSFIKQMKQDGNFQKCDVLYWMQGDGDAFFRCINLVDPELSGTPYGGLILTNQGIEGNGIDGYIETNLTNDMTNEAQPLNTGITVYISKISVSASNHIWGKKESTTDFFRLEKSKWFRINSISNVEEDFDMRDLGYKSLNRIDNNIIAINNLSEESQNISSIVVNTKTFNFFRSFTGYGNMRIDAASIGSAITGQDAINYRQAIINNLI